MKGSSEHSSLQKLEKYRALSCNPKPILVHTDYSTQSSSTKRLYPVGSDSRLCTITLYPSKQFDATRINPISRTKKPERSESPQSFMMCSFEGEVSTRTVTDRKVRASTKQEAPVKRGRRQTKETLPPIHSNTPTFDKSFGKLTVTRTSSHFYKPSQTKAQTKRRTTRNFRKPSNVSVSPSRREQVNRRRVLV